MNWETITFRASSWGNLLTDPVTKAAKEAGELSVTCQKELIKIYNREKYGRKKDIVTKQMDKGILCEQDAIDLFNRVEGKMYFKNQEELENEWFRGHPDIFTGDNIQNADDVSDIKCSWELDTFMPKLVDGLDKSYEAQLNVYFSLTGAQQGSIAYCLVSAPANIVEGEKYSLLRRMNVATDENTEFKKAFAEMERNMIVDDIDYRERVIKIPVVRNEELIEKMKAKVPALRIWLSDFEEKHLKLYPKEEIFV